MSSVSGEEIVSITEGEKLLMRYLLTLHIIQIEAAFAYRGELPLGDAQAAELRAAHDLRRKLED